MIRAVVFDMDGVLIEAKEWHYEALNRALELFGFTITPAEHRTTFDGLPTRTKLEMLTAKYGLPRKLHGFLNDLKQRYTLDLVYQQCRPTFQHEYALSQLKRRGYKLGVASNSVRHTVEVMMDRAHLRGHLDLLLSNQDVPRPKPHPDLYVEAMARFGLAPAEVLVVEDNENGVRAAAAAGAHVLVVRDVHDVHLGNIMGRIRAVESGAAGGAA